MRNPKRSAMNWPLVALATAMLVAGSALWSTTGCGAIDLGGTRARLDTAQADLAAAQAKAATDAADARAAIAAALAANNAAGAAVAEKALEKANTTAKLAEEWAKKLAEAKALMDKAVKPDGSIDATGAIGAAAPLIPPPWNLLLGIAAPLVIGLVQEVRVRRENAAAVSIINGIEAAKASTPGFKPMLDNLKPVLMAEFTDRAITLIDENKLARTT